MASVQFYGKDQVLVAAERLRCSAWGIYISRNLFSKYEGTDLHESLDLLSQNLEALEPSGTTGIYTLKFFETPGNKPIKINERTVCDGGSFNFKLIDPEERDARGIGNISTNSYISKLEQRLAALENGEQEEEEEETIGSVLLDVVKNPEKLATLVNVFRGSIGMPLQNFGNTIGTVRAGLPSLPESTTVDATTEKTEQDLNRLGHAIDTLDKNVPGLVDKLEMLAKMPPDKLNSIVSLIDLYK